MLFEHVLMSVEGVIAENSNMMSSTGLRWISCLELNMVLGSQSRLYQWPANPAGNLDSGQERRTPSRFSAAADKAANKIGNVFLILLSASAI